MIGENEAVTTAVPPLGNDLPSIGAVVLSQGTRMVEVVRCLDSLRAQVGVELDILVVGNGWEPEGIGTGVRALALPENLGIPEGRNVGAAAVKGDLICFIDDDAWIDDPHLLARMANAFALRPEVGSVQPHVCDEHGTTMRRWVPRWRTSDPSRPGPGFTIAECIFAVRREAFDGVGGWPGHFFYGHEGIDLSWRLWDAGWEVFYAGNLTAHHPATGTTPATGCGWLDGTCPAPSSRSISRRGSSSPCAGSSASLVRLSRGAVALSRGGARTRASVAR
jgi:hypothetical protein